ncbi:MAG TPA: hypothetical protein VGR49_06685 [Actinomycetota bacterium]|jgi:hypothetical protein|nr:hypothetical protein [Actinomycetota bacterium]
MIVAVALPQLGDYVKAGHVHWDSEQLLELAIIVVIAVIVFAIPVRWAAAAPAYSARPAKTGLVLSVLGSLGVVVFYLSIPIVFGAAGAFLGWEGRIRSKRAGAAGLAIFSMVLGLLALLAGIVLWLVA